MERSLCVINVNKKCNELLVFPHNLSEIFVQRRCPAVLVFSSHLQQMLGFAQVFSFFSLLFSV